jgi:hypothetical protein
MNFIQRFKKLISTDSISVRAIESIERGKFVKVQLTFDNGLVRTLENDAATDWQFDLYQAVITARRRIDWDKHKWHQEFLKK